MTGRSFFRRIPARLFEHLRAWAYNQPWALRLKVALYKTGLRRKPDTIEELSCTGMTIEILKLTLGPLQANCYIIGDTTTQDAIVIDPSDRAALIEDTAAQHGWTIREILATHGHFDHIMASGSLKTKTNATFRCHEQDLALVRNMSLHTRRWLSIDVPPAARPDMYVVDGEQVVVGGIVLEVLHTPGHTPGGVSYVLRSEKTVFSGDTLFCGSVGRTDLPGGDSDALQESILTKLLPLGDEFVVAPGHQQTTTIGYERLHNPFLIERLT